MVVAGGWGKEEVGRVGLVGERSFPNPTTPSHYPPPLPTTPLNQHHTLPPVGYMIQLMLALSLNVDHKMINSIIFVMQFPDEYNSINPSIFALGFNVSSYRISINDLHSSCL